MTSCLTRKLSFLQCWGVKAFTMVRKLSRAEAATLRDGHPHASDLDLKIRHTASVREAFVELVDQGLGRKRISHELDLSIYAVRDWQRMYEALGREQFLDLTPERTSYPYETKLAAVHDVTEGRLTRAEALKKHGIAHPATLTRWIKLYRAGGDEALVEKKRGRRKHV